MLKIFAARHPIPYTHETELFDWKMFEIRAYTVYTRLSLIVYAVEWRDGMQQIDGADT